MWPHATVDAHVLLFAALRHEAHSEPAGRGVLEAVGLGADCAKRAGDLSGGMRRRLSTALALVGKPAVIVLDEPTAGLGETRHGFPFINIRPTCLCRPRYAHACSLPFISCYLFGACADPLSRRHVWDALRRCVARDQACVLLTTHSLDEAEALCHRLGIVVRGALQCLGTPLRLKQTYGRGYEVSVQLAAHRAGAGSRRVGSGGVSAQVSAALSRFGAAFPSLEVLEQDRDAHFKVRVPKGHMDLPKCFALLDDMCRSSGEQQEAFYCVSLSSIEQVFLDVVDQAN